MQSNQLAIKHQRIVNIHFKKSVPLNEVIYGFGF